ncbi:protein phosphatase 2C domain-containing protein [Streptomyces sp. NBC_00401]|uniref:protein phosphatase 2C domain-containing protein n=1 Tax=Streptomyces sp. NBC_00401 TaxID=2975738 RepID=UPI002253FD25|nr:protein phosphatase 2C domain-containing protein [Streptomyces sp. NBC_00401]MCX5084510.1 protein phosphatase 2C domain-containing protein [Streptomyces sp. NBC_00401]
MGLLTIGAFAKASRLSPKALRLYDELGLLNPARVDPVTGYRLYAMDQLDQARLVAWLRRLGMPLARIRHVTALDAAGAAQEIRAFWAQVEADTAARRDLATFLIDQLSWKDPAMSPTAKPLGIRYAALSDTGLVRESNQDTAYAGCRVLAVADGYGSGGATASAAAVDVLKRFETDSVPAGDLLSLLEDAVEEAKRAVHGVPSAGSSSDEASRAAVGTTLTAMLWTGAQLALVHIGDSRVYLLRAGELFQITHDHTLVQSMVDEGRISPEEALSHPQRSLLTRALGQGADETPDMRLHDAQHGDRYLLCSDGLSTVVPGEDILRVLAETREPDETVRALVALANGIGGPDNVGCVVADVMELQP